MAGRDESSMRESTLAAVRLLGTPNLHQCMWLPGSDSHERLRVSFSTTGNFDDKSLPVVLFIGGMFGSRYGSLLYDKVARDIGIRVICIDRPGIGGSTPAPLEQRMNIWLETVRALLKELHVEHVSLVSHSAGTMYLLNTLHHLRDILDPAAPFVACLAPWVHFEHSQATLWKLVSKLPEDLINTWHNINSFIVTKVMPMGSWSSGIISSMGNVLNPKSSSSSSDEAVARETYGVDKATAKEISRLTAKYLFTEGVTGADQEALLCLKKSKPGVWDVCGDYREYVGNFIRIEERQSANDRAAAKLRLRIFFAESDIMIGTHGAEYFTEIWRQDGVSDYIDVQSKTLPGTDHDSVVLDFQAGAIKQVFEEIRSITK